jgi:hypothetical protein
MFFVKARVFVLIIMFFSYVPLVSAEVLDLFLEKQVQAVCGISSTEDIIETACHWDVAAQQSGDCSASKFMEIVGHAPVMNSCISILEIASWPTTSVSLNESMTVGQKKVFRLLRALQSAAIEAVTITEPACVATLELDMTKFKAKKNYVDYFACLAQRDDALQIKLSTDKKAAALRRIQKTIDQVDLNEQDVLIKIDELVIAIEDDPSMNDMENIDKLIDGLQ